MDIGKALLGEPERCRTKQHSRHHEPSYNNGWPKSGRRGQNHVGCGSAPLHAGWLVFAGVRLRRAALQIPKTMPGDQRPAPVNSIRTLFSSRLFFLQDLAALVHAGLQIEVVRTAQFAGILVLGIGRLLQGIGRTAHATPRGRCFSTGNGHIGIL
jgi:hypothetical protein